jgi:hypothetical protein
MARGLCGAWKFSQGRTKSHKLETTGLLEMLYQEDITFGLTGPIPQYA